MKKIVAALAIFCYTIISGVEASAHWPWHNHSHRVIGYQPQVVWMPQGTTLNVNNVYVDPYKRTVTVGVNAGFYHIPQVTTFNYYGTQPIINYNYWRR